MDLLSDPSSSGDNPLPSETQQRVSDAAGKVKSKWGGRRTAGVGKKYGNAGNGVGQVKPPEEPPQDVASQADLVFVEETAKSILRVVDKLVTTKVYNAVSGIVPGDAKLAEQGDALAKEVHIEEGEIDLVGRTSKAIAAKYPLFTRFAPEMALAGWVSTYGMRVTKVLSEVRKLTAAVRAMQGPGNASRNAGSPPPNENIDSR